MANIRDFGEGVPHVYPVSHQDVTHGGSRAASRGSAPTARQPQGRQPGLHAKPRSPSALAAALIGTTAAYLGTSQPQDGAHRSLGSPGQSEAGAGCPLRCTLGWLPAGPPSCEMSESVCRHGTNLARSQNLASFCTFCAPPFPVLSCKVRCNCWSGEEPSRTQY